MEKLPISFRLEKYSQVENVTRVLEKAPVQDRHNAKDQPSRAPILLADVQRRLQERTDPPAPESAATVLQATNHDRLAAVCARRAKKCGRGRTVRQLHY
mmetsp:Transcript_7998/g.4218  ORF Transcript_7998/g.4218 Transcript_7998/m.4218 type:complete len:99 (-) Transcript_7998:936-1232(-)